MLLPWLRNQNLTISVPVRLFRFAFDLKFRKSRNVDLIWKGDLKLMNNGHIISAVHTRQKFMDSFPCDIIFYQNIPSQS